MDQFWEEFETGEIHFRDKWQFELKSEFFPLPNKPASTYTQEFFIFVPNSLQINPQTYSKNEFYNSQTNLIRFKTPEISFKELLNPNNIHSPLINLKNYLNEGRPETSSVSLEWELKLFANIFRSTLRRELYSIMLHLEPATSQKELEECKQAIEELFANMNSVLETFQSIKEEFSHRSEWLKLHFIFGYIEDFVSISINSLTTELLKALHSKNNSDFKALEEKITQLLLKEKEYREKRLKEPSQLNNGNGHNEAILFQSGLLNKFVMDALQLKTERLAVDERFRSVIGSISAAVAMLLYLVLFVWQGTLFVINSLPFIFFSVFIYVLKDRIKEELKTLSYKHVFRLFPDYTTEIQSPSDKVLVGKTHDSFAFIDEKQVPNDIWKVRNEGFHTYLEMIKRPEQVIYYKKQIDIDADPQANTARLGAFNIIFRYDLHKFMAKASDPYEPYTTIDSQTLDLITTQLPKVYHINIILKISYLNPDLTPHVERKKFRLVVDKEGIKRVENLSENHKKETS